MSAAALPGAGTPGAAGSQPPPPREDVALMPGYHSPRLEVEVRLNVNEAPEPPPASFLAALVEEVHRLPLNRYPDRAATALREALAAHHGLDPAQVFCGNGSNEVLQCLLLAYGGPGREVGVFEPTYALHSHIARLTGTGVIEGSRDEDFLVGGAELERIVAAEPVVTFLCSPNNPTGALEPFETIERALALTPGLVVVDEAYGQFAPRSAIELLGGLRRNLVVVRTFSKTWSLAGLRLGYLLADSEVVEACDRVALPYHLDALKQAAGRLALQFDAEMRARVQRLVTERERLAEGLRALGCAVVPSAANFLLFSTAGRDARAVWQALVDRSVLVRDVSSWSRLAGHLRVTVGTPEEDDRFLQALAAALA